MLCLENAHVDRRMQDLKGMNSVEVESAECGIVK